LAAFPTTPAGWPLVGQCQSIDRLRKLPPRGSLPRRAGAARLPAGCKSQARTAWVRTLYPAACCGAYGMGLTLAARVSADASGQIVCRSWRVP
jgi:hypothetical protein